MLKSIQRYALHDAEQTSVTGTCELSRSTGDRRDSPAALFCTAASALRLIDMTGTWVELSVTEDHPCAGGR